MIIQVCAVVQRGVPDVNDPLRAYLVLLDRFTFVPPSSDGQVNQEFENCS